MEDDRKRVALFGESDAFNQALRVLLGRLEVTVGSLPDPANLEGDLLVWRFEDQVPDLDLARLALRLPVLVVAPESQLIRSVDAGCRGFLPLSATLDQVNDAVTTILDGGAVVPPELLGTLLRHLVDRRRRVEHFSETVAGLTERESDVFELAAQGARKDQIAERLFISPATARTHLQRVYRKLGVHSQAELMALAAQVSELKEEE